MDSLKLGLVGLSAAEESLVRTLFRLHKVEPSFIWALAERPPFDALLVDVDAEPAAYQNLKGKQTKVRILGRVHDDSEGVMPRPIRSDLLVQWLNSIEVGILHGGSDLYASTAGEHAYERPGDSRSAGRPPLNMSSLLGTEVDSALDAFRAGRNAFKLKRWPSPDLLQGDVSRIRIATLLSRKHLALKDLAALSRVPAERCVIFVRALFKARLLGVEEVGGSAAAARVSGAPMDHSQDAGSPVPLKARGLGSSLIASIRKRFGIL